MAWLWSAGTVSGQSLELLELGSLQEKNINKHDHEALSADTWNTTALLGHGHGMKALGATWTWLNMQNKNENTWCYMASWKHCVLDIRQCIFLDLQLWPWWPIDHQTWCPCHTGRYSTSAAGTAGLYHWTCF